MATLAEFAQQLEESGIVPPDKLKSLLAARESLRTAGDLARELVKQNQLTRFQAQQAYDGKAKSLVMGNYTLLDKIGAGGMGQVYKARHRRMDRIVAVKMLPPAVVKDTSAQARFQREVFAAAKLSHVNIVAAFDADLAGDAPFLVMEYVDGTDLAALVRRGGPLPIAKAVGCIVQTARGLDYAHKQGIVHRDIKPGNLLVDKAGRIKILDMGLARMQGPNQTLLETQAELTNAGTVVGTIDYMAPEQAVDSKLADHRSDIYSLGCTLYFLLSGKAVYDDDTVIGKLLAHREKPIPSLAGVQPQVPAALDEVFRRMVAKKPDDRFQSMGEVIAALQSFGKPPSGIAVAPPEISGGQTAVAASAPLSDSVGQTAASGSGVSQLAATPHKWTPRKIAIAGGAGIPAAILIALLLHALGGSTTDGDPKPTPGNDHTVSSTTSPSGNSTGPSGKSPGPSAASGLDHQVAAWVLTHGRSWLKIAVGTQGPLEVKPEDSLPPAPFKVIEITLEDVPITEKELLRLAKLSDLAKLTLVNDGVTDAMLTKLPRLSNLNYLNVAGNPLTAAGLKQIARQTELQSLGLYGDVVSSEALRNLEPLVNLNRLDLGNTQIDADRLRQLGRLAKLNRLEVTNTPLTDADLTGLSGERLTMLNLARTKITDAGLGQLPTLLPELRYLGLQETSVTATGVAAVKQALPNCLVEWTPAAAPTPAPTVAPAVVTDRAAAEWVFSIQGTAQLTISEAGGLERVLPPGARLPPGPFRITEINFFNAPQQNPDFSRLNGLTELRRLSMQRCDLSDAMLAALPPLPALEFLSLAGNPGVTDAALKSLGARTNLRTLILSGTGVSGAGLLYLRPLAKLNSLTLNNLTDFRGQSLGELAALSGLRHVALVQTPLGDAELAALKSDSLQILDLRLTRITDEGLKRLPEQLPRLDWINVANTVVTAGGIAALEKALPRCIIEWTPPAK